MDRLYNSLSRSLLSHCSVTFFFVRSRTVRSLHLPCTQIHRTTKMTKDWRRQGCRLKGGCPPCLAPGVGGTLSIKVSQVPIGIAAFDWQIWVDVCFVSSTYKSGDFLFETIGYIKGTYLYIDKLVCRPGKLLMQRHDDGVRNNVIHPSVILSLPLPSSRHRSDGSGDKQTRQGKEKRKKEKRNGEQERQRPEGIRRPNSYPGARPTRQQRRARKDPPNPPLRWTMHVQVATVNLPSFQKLSVAARLKATAHQASWRCVQPIKRHPALGPCHRSA